MKQKVLIAVGEKSYSSIIKETFEKHQEEFVLSTQEVLHRRFLAEILDIEKPDFLIIHDYYLESDFTEQELRDQELAQIFRTVRVNYDDSLRIVFLCERSKGDPFLSSLVSMGIMDIFNKNSFDLDDFIDQLLEKPRFSRVEKFLLTSAPLVQVEPAVDGREKANEENLNENENKEEKEHPSTVNRKIIEKKETHRNIVKRDYHIHIHNKTGKVVGVPLKKKLIIIGNLAPRSGSTFISHLLARGLSQLGIETTYIENPFRNGYTFDRFFGHQKTMNYSSLFHQYSKNEANEEEPNDFWELEGVDLICKNSTKEKVYLPHEITFEAFIKILFATKSIVTIVDVGSDWENELFKDVFDIADHAYFLLEPDLPFIQYWEESKDESVLKINEMLRQEKSCLIGNRFHPKLEGHSLIENMYEDRLLTSFPSFDVHDVFQAQYKGIFLNDYKDYERKTESYLSPLFEDILPEQFLKKKKKGKGFLKGIFNKRITINKSEPKGEKYSV